MTDKRIDRKRGYFLRCESGEWLFDFDGTDTYRIDVIDTESEAKLDTIYKILGGCVEFHVSFEAIQRGLIKRNATLEFEAFTFACEVSLYHKQKGRVLLRNGTCGCLVCMNEYNESTIVFDNDVSIDKVRLHTTWGEWQHDINGGLYRERILDYLVVEDLKIPASDLEKWGIYGVYSWGHVIVDLAPSDTIEYPIVVLPFM